MNRWGEAFEKKRGLLDKSCPCGKTRGPRSNDSLNQEKKAIMNAERRLRDGLR